MKQGEPHPNISLSAYIINSAAMLYDYCYDTNTTAWNQSCLTHKTVLHSRQHQKMLKMCQQQQKDLGNKTLFLFHSEAGIPFFKYAIWTIFSGQFSVRPLWLSTFNYVKSANQEEMSLETQKTMGGKNYRCYFEISIFISTEFSILYNDPYFIT